MAVNLALGSSRPVCILALFDVMCAFSSFVLGDVCLVSKSRHVLQLISDR